MLGKMGLRDQNNGKKVGINGSRIYHVTTLPQRSDHAEAKTVRRFGNFFFLSHHRLRKNNITLFHLMLSGREEVVFVFVHSLDSAAV